MLNLQDPAEIEGEKQRIKEQKTENKKEISKIKGRLARLKSANSIKDFRYNEITKSPTFYPDKPEIPTIQVKAKNVQKDLFDDIFTKKEVQVVQNKNKVKIMNRLRQEQRQKEKMADILNQSFNSEDMNERKDLD